MILVTGATGLVGGHLAWHLLQTHESIKATKRNTSNLSTLRTIFSFYSAEPDQYLQRIEWVEANVLAPESLDIALSGVTTVYHCAAVVSLGKSGNELTDTNVTGTRNMVVAALRNKTEHFCFVSSIAACGNEPDGTAINEDSPWLPSARRSVYSDSKYLAELEVWNGIRKGLKAVIVNPGVILGVSGTSSGSAQLFNQVRKGMPFYTNGGTGYINVQDVVKAMIRLMESSIRGERFVLVAENCSNKEILSWIADGYKKQRPFICMTQTILLPVAFISEIIGKIIRVAPVLDRSMARTALGRKYYSSAKFTKATNYKFASIESSIKNICTFTKNDYKL